MIFYPYADVRRNERAASVRAVVGLAENRCIVRPHWCYEDVDYALGLRSVWNDPDDLVIIEHDIVPSPTQVNELLECNNSLCCFAYYLAPHFTGNIKPIFAQSNDGVAIEKGDSYCLSSGLGFVKIAPFIRERTELPPIEGWVHFDMAVNRTIRKAFKDISWHVHWPPVRHEHGFIREKINA